MIILNRREKLRASALPPEIPDGATLVKKTDKASATKLGLVKIGDNVDISSSGAISVPVGSSETAGVFKVGNGLTVEEGVLSATAGAGFTAEEIWTGSQSLSTASENDTLEDFSDYKLIGLVTESSGITVETILGVSPANEGTISFFWFAANNNAQMVVCTVVLTATKLTTRTGVGGTGMTLKKVIGYK